MKLLALETTQPAGSVAVLEGGNLLCELQLDRAKRTTQSLAPGIKTVLDRVGWTPEAIDLVAVPIGPGSFTGLRVGVTAAKTFAYATGADILGVDTLEAVAWAVPDWVNAVWVALDAQRGQVAAALFGRNPDGFLAHAKPSQLLDLEAWLAALTPGSIVTGPALRKVAHRLPDDVEVLDQRYWFPSAAGVGRVAFWHYQAGRRDDLWALVPRYFRRSAAEEKWEQKRR